MTRSSTPLSRRCVAKLWRRLWAVTGLPNLTLPRATRQASCNAATPTCSPDSRPGNSHRPGRARFQYARVEQARRQHRVAILRALAAFNVDQHALAVDRGYLQTANLADAEPRRVGRRQRDPVP